MSIAGSYLDDIEAHFAYVTVQAVSDAGAMTGSSDVDVWQAIQAASHRINWYTSRWFSPVYLEPLLDGLDWRRLHLPNWIPFIQVDDVTLECGPNAAVRVLARTDYIVKSLWVEMRRATAGGITYRDGVPIGGDPFRDIANRTDINHGDRGPFREGIGNVSMAAWLGLLKTPPLSRADARAGGRVYPTTTVATDISAAATGSAGKAFEVASTTGAKLGWHVVVKGVGDIEAKLTGIITAIGSGPDTITVDFFDEDLVEDDEVFFFPAPPRQIREALLVLLLNPELAFGDAAQGAATGPGPGLFYSEERTDAYHYKVGLSSLASSSGVTGGKRSTGVPEVDRLLSEFVRPAYASVV